MGIYREMGFSSAFKVGDEGELAQLQPSLQSARIWAKRELRLPPGTSDAEGRTAESPRKVRLRESELSLKRSERKLQIEFLPIHLQIDELLTGDFQIAEIDKETEDEATEDRVAPRLVGAGAAHFLPDRVVVQYDRAATLAGLAAEALSEMLLTYKLRRQSVDAINLPTSVRAIIIHRLLAVGLTFEHAPASVQEFATTEAMTVAAAIDRLKTFARRANRDRNYFEGENLMRATLRDFRPDLTNAILATLRDNVDEGPAIEYPLDIYRPVNAIRALFSDFTRYLGPLRDEPRPLYPLEALSEPTDVGYRGEHTAAVLELNKNRLVSFVDPKAFETGLLPAVGAAATLHDAVVTWLSYLGVAVDVQTSDKGKFGHEMQVLTGDVAKAHDLTNVGVGVSQVLPIVVMALLAPRSAVLIFEQPELHLHPKVQARLADFFLSLVVLGKQCVLETHSEHLLLRLRRRIAEFTERDLSELVRVYFVERLEGRSQYRPIEISRFGAIENWPQDFFDQGDEETERLILAAQRKRTLQPSKPL